MTLSSPDIAARETPRRFAFAPRVAQWRNVLRGTSDRAAAQRAAGVALGVRIASAGILYVSHILLARWMGSFEFGIYVTVWTWVLLLGGLADLGLSTAAQRLIPELGHAKTFDRLRGFLLGSRLLVLAVATLVALTGAGVVWLLGDRVAHHLMLPLVLAFACVPLYALGAVQSGIARSQDWMNLALLPPYILRPLLLLGAMAGAYALGFAADAVTALWAAIAATWLTTTAQVLLLNRRLAARVEAGPRRFAMGEWLGISMPIFVTAAFYFLLTYVDILVLQHFRPPEEVAVYYAASKTIGLVAFISFAVAGATAHRFSASHVAGDRARLAALVASASRWTFWPSLAGGAVLLALGWPLLRMFGPQFTAGYALMFVLCAGVLARAAVGPAERLLNMLGEQRACAAVYAAAFAVALVACLLLVPRFGALGAGAAMSGAMMLESVLLYAVARRRLGLHVFVWSRS